MTSMVERMARAMYGAARRDEDWEAAPPEMQDLFLDYALAALRELREPTEVMGAAMEAYDDRAGMLPVYSAAFTSAIDAEIAAYEAGRADPLLRTP